MPVLGPLVAYVQTPRSASGRLVEQTFETLIENAIAAGVDAVSVLGSVGGAAYMPRALRKKVIAKAVAVADGRVPIFAGVGALTTVEVGLNLADAASVGASGALLQPMSYQPLLPHEVMFLYERANELTSIPLWVYNNPATTRHVFSTEELASIAALENVSGFKDRAANAPELKHRIEYIAASLPAKKAEQFNWGFSGETKGALVLGSGGHTWHSALAGIMPKLCVELAQAAVAGRENSDVAAFAMQMQRVLNPLTVTMTQYGGIRVAHAIAQQQGLDVGELPQPLRPLPPAVHGIVHLALESIDRSLVTMQQQLAQGGIAAASSVRLDAEVPTLGEFSGLERARRIRHSNRVNVAAPHARATQSSDTAGGQMPNHAGAQFQEQFGVSSPDHSGAHGKFTEPELHPNSAQSPQQSGMRLRDYQRAAFEDSTAVSQTADVFDQETALLRSVELFRQEPQTAATATPESAGVVRRSVLTKGTPGSDDQNAVQSNPPTHRTPDTAETDDLAIGMQGMHVINPISPTSNGAYGRLRNSQNTPNTPTTVEVYVPERLDFESDQTQVHNDPRHGQSDPDATLVLNLHELSQPESYTAPANKSAIPVPPVPSNARVLGGDSREHVQDAKQGSLQSILPGNTENTHQNDNVPMTRSAARAAREALRSQQEQTPGLGAQVPPATNAQSELTGEFSLEQLFSQNSPTRVSAKARIQNEATRAELEHAAEHFLLSGDPEVDQTRINMERVDVPLLGGSARDSSNYVPRRARADGE